METGSDSDARFLATFSSREAVVPEIKCALPAVGKQPAFFFLLPVFLSDLQGFTSQLQQLWFYHWHCLDTRGEFSWQSLGSCSLFA